MSRTLESIQDELDALDRDGLRRVLTSGDDLDRDVLTLCSNDYLGLASDPRLTAAATDCAARDGFGAGAARLITGTHAAHISLERAVASLTGYARTLTFGSGFAANLATLGALVGDGDLAVSDALNHASLIDGLRLTHATRRVVPHHDVAAVRDALRDAGSFRRVVVVTEGLFSMDGDVAPLADLLDVCRKARSLLYVDDAHGTGVLGATGGGTLEQHGVDAADDVVRIGTFGKAFGAAGAFLAAATPIVDLTLNRGRAFVFSTAPPPPVAAAAEAAMTIARDEPWRRERCLATARRLAALLRERDVDVPTVAGPILPIPIGDPYLAVAASRLLLDDHAIHVSAIRPPTVPDGTSRLRLTTSPALDDTDVERVADAIAATLRKVR